MKSGACVGLFAAVLLTALPVLADLLSGSAEPSPKQRLQAIFVEYWDDELKADPINATYLGDHRFDDRLPDPSLEARAVRVKRWGDFRKRLTAIDPKSLSPDSRIDFEVLLYTLEDRLAGEAFRGFLIPFTQQEGLHLAFAQNVNFQPSATSGDFENYVRRLNGFPEAVEATIVLMKQGMAEKRVPPKVTMAKVVPQLRALATAKPADSPLRGIVDKIPTDWPLAERKRTTDAIDSAIETRVSPAFKRWADFLEAEYLPACRETVGLWATPDGPSHYAYLVKSFTTTDITPDQVYEIGLVEVAKTRRAMDEIRKKVGFSGDLDAFLTHLRTDPKFRNVSPDEMMARYRGILSTVDAKLPELFGKLPKTDYGLKAIEAYRAKSAAAGYYYPFPEDGSRPGYFYVNISEPDKRTTFSMQALAYHEAVPGHHLQFALTIEAADRPAFRRNGYIPAFSEGWGLYSESLPGEVGLYTDPYADYGRLEYNAWRSARLVVDTGLHHKRWTREQAIAYLEKNSAMPRMEIESEVDRYIAWPGQALAYKMGELRIRAIRAETERRLGKDFDIRAFHDRLLSQGSLPLSVLERWMGEKPKELKK